jgi:flagellar biosynthesis chaperone FliJ
MKADVRRFDYALEPLRRQRQWRMDALQAQLGRVQQQIERAERALADLRDEHAVQSERAAQAAGKRLDPIGYSRLLWWLAQLRRTIHCGEEALADLHASRAQVSAACLAQQRKVDVIERHREDCMSEFVREEQGRLSAEADRDWLSRRRWADARGPDDTEAGLARVAP